MYHSITRCIISFAILFSVPLSALATPITYIYTGSDASGSIGGMSFTNVDFTVTALADTDNIGTWCCSDGQNTHISTTIAIDGFSVFDILTPSHSWYDTNTVGLGENLSANWMTFSLVELAGYDLSTSIGPVFGTAFHVNQFNDVLTSGGILSFTDSSLAGSFQAIASNVPEPTILTLIVLGLVGIGYNGKQLKKV